MKKISLNVACLGLLGLSLAACGGGSSDEEGQFEVRWTFASGRACAADEAVRVSYAPDVGTDTFPCLSVSSGEQEGLTGNLPLGTYVVSVELGTGGTAGAPFVPSAVAPVDVSSSLDFDGDVQTVDVVFNDAGGSDTFNVSFAVDFGVVDAGASPNCTQTNVGGLGVSQQHITLLDMTAGQCVPFEITGTDQDGAAIDGNTCDAIGTNMLCMEAAVVQTISGLPAGDYVLEIRGFKSGSTENACWVAAYEFDTADSLTEDITLGSLNAPFDTASTEPSCQEKPSRITVASN